MTKKRYIIGLVVAFIAAATFHLDSFFTRSHSRVTPTKVDSDLVTKDGFVTISKKHTDQIIANFKKSQIQVPTPLAVSPSESQEKKVRPAPVSTPLPDINFFRTANSRVFTYLRSDDLKRVKIDLFFDWEPKIIADFIKHILSCHGSSQNQTSCPPEGVTFKFVTPEHLSYQNPVKLDIGANNYIGFLYAENSDNQNFSILIKPAKYLPSDLHVIGGVLPGSMSLQGVISVTFRYRDILFTYRKDDDPDNEADEFGKILSLFKSKSQGISEEPHHTNK